VTRPQVYWRHLPKVDNLEKHQESYLQTCWLFAQVFESTIYSNLTHPPPPYPQKKKKFARFEDKCNFIIIHQTFFLIVKHFGKLTIIGGWLLSTNPLKPYWIPNIDFTPYTSNDITICIIILPQMDKCIGTKIPKKNKFQ